MPCTINMLRPARTPACVGPAHPTPPSLPPLVDTRRHNGIGYDGLAALATGLEANATLASLKLW